MNSPAMLHTIFILVSIIMLASLINDERKKQGIAWNKIRHLRVVKMLVLTIFISWVFCGVLIFIASGIMNK